MATDREMVAEGVRVVSQRTDDPDRQFYLPQIKVAGVWVDVTRSDYQPHDFRSCVESALAAAANELEKGDEVVWSVEDFIDEDGEEAVAYGYNTDYVDELAGLPHVTIDADDDGESDQLVRVVLEDDDIGLYAVQMRVGQHWIGGAKILGIDAAIKIAERVSEQLRSPQAEDRADDVRWVDAP